MSLACALFATISIIMGIIAIQKSMTLKMSFNVNPVICCEIQVKGKNDTKFETIFNNASTPQIIGVGVTLSGNILGINNDYGNAFGANFLMKITNFNDFDMVINFNGASVIDSGEATSAILLATNQTSNDLSVSSLNSMQMTMSQGAMITYMSHDGTTFAKIPVAVGGEYSFLTPPARNDYEFLGWSSTQNATTAEWSSGVNICNTAKTWYPVWKSAYYSLTIKFEGTGYVHNDATMEIIQGLELNAESVDFSGDIQVSQDKYTSITVNSNTITLTGKGEMNFIVFSPYPTAGDTSPSDTYLFIDSFEYSDDLTCEPIEREVGAYTGIFVSGIGQDSQLTLNTYAFGGW